MRSTTALVGLALPLLLALAPAPRSQEDGPSPWDDLRRLVGRWEGTSTGKFGDAKVEKTWEFVLDGAFLQGTTHSVSAGEVHRDLGMFSWDRAREAFVLREFHSEGYVNRYAVSIEDDGATIVVTTEEIENAFAPGLRAKSTIRFLSDDEFRETFCLATGEGPWEVCVELELRRVD